jgi:hypothetical protein
VKPSTELIARIVWLAFAQHPKVIALLVAQQVSNRNAIRVYEMLSDALSDAGFTDREVLGIIGIFDNYTTGAGLDVSAPSDVWVFSEHRSALQRSLADPELAANRSVIAFEFGLELLVDGLRARLADRSSIAASS